MSTKICFGIDLGGTTVKIGCFAMSGELLDKWEIPTRKDDGGSKILDDIADAVKKYLADKEKSLEDVCGVGLGVPGAVRPDGYVNKCINLGWGVIPVEKLLSEKLDGITVKAGNDANMAALGEYGSGAGKQYSSIVFVTIGTGVGGGIIVDGKPLVGFNGAAAEIGHLTVEYGESKSCNCGKKGCLEQYASASGIVAMANEMLSESDEPSSLREVPFISAKAVFDEAKVGDAIATKVVDKAAWYLGIAFAHIGCNVDPECFIVGGGVSAAGEFLTERIIKTYRENVFHASKNTQIVLASLSNDAGMYGAAHLILGCE